jgi:hypothetical protein
MGEIRHQIDATGDAHDGKYKNQNGFLDLIAIHGQALHREQVLMISGICPIRY